MSKNEWIINLEREIAHFYHKYFTLIPEKRHYIFKHGRAVTTSSFLAALDIFRMFRLPHRDTMCIMYDETGIKSKILHDYEWVFEHYKIPKVLYEVVKPDKGEKYILIKNKWGVNKIWFRHGKDKSESFKGLRPSPGNKWGCLRMYELTYFYGWNSHEITNLIATFIRESWGGINIKKCREYCEKNNIMFIEDEQWIKEQPWYLSNYSDFMEKGFCVQYEYNTPIPGMTSGVWVESWEKQMIKRKDTEFVFQNYLDLTISEQLRFLGSEILEEIKNLKEISPSEYDNIYLGLPGYNGLTTFPNLSEENFGEFNSKDFNPDCIGVGVDCGLLDATVFSATAFQIQENKDLKILFGDEYWFHSNYRKEHFINDERKPWSYKSIDDYLMELMNFLKKVHEKHPLLTIYLLLDEQNIGEAYIVKIWSYLDQLPPFVRPYIQLISKWKKEPIADRITTFNRAFGCKDVCKIRVRKLFDAYKNQIYNEKIKEDTGERVRVDDRRILTLDMDSQDATEYSLRPDFYEIIRKRIKKNLGKKLY